MICTIDLPTCRRYLEALDVLKRNSVHCGYARQQFMELANAAATVQEHIGPIVRTPLHQLSPSERAWRRIADSIGTHQAASCLA